jgi:plasmid stabilization system protein ParE
VSAPRIRVRAQAESEIDSIARYIAARNLEAGKRFYDAVEDALNKLAKFPGMGAAHGSESESAAVTFMANCALSQLPHFLSSSF